MFASNKEFKAVGSGFPLSPVWGLNFRAMALQLSRTGEDSPCSMWVTPVLGSQPTNLEVSWKEGPLGAPEKAMMAMFYCILLHCIIIIL